MAQQNRATLKGYFNTGDFPTEANFGDLIDSNLNLTADTTDNITEGDTNKFLSASSIINVTEQAVLTGDTEFIFVNREDDSLKRCTIDNLASAESFSGRYQPIAVTDTVPANGALPNGKQILVVNSTVGRELYVGDASNNPVPACGYRQYVALLSQSGTDAPVATVLKNTLGGTVAWTRQAVGYYLFTGTGLFTANKTFVTARLNDVYNDTAITNIFARYISSISINTGDLQKARLDVDGGFNGYFPDDGLGTQGVHFEIRVYV